MYPSSHQTLHLAQKDKFLFICIGLLHEFKKLSYSSQIGTKREATNTWN
jgi:hypothetical protein